MSDVDFIEMNRVGWDRRTEAHIGSAFYDVQGFLAGNTSLREIELNELRQVSGRRLLHLQCHFGLDTLSWARLGAICTGVDISPVAIDYARELARKVDLDAEFVCSDLYSFRSNEPDAYDIIFTSYGTVNWLPDLKQWAEIVASNLAVGGTFYMVDFHPLHDLLDGHAYFSNEVPDVGEEGTYTENSADAVAKLATWSHPLSSVLNALINAGIQIGQINEFPFSPYNCFKGLEQREPGRYYLNYQGNDVPMTYSIAGRVRQRA